MNQEQINTLGDELYEALRTFRTVVPLTDRESGITIEDAYYISQRMVSRRLELDGEKIVGKKIGVTRCREFPEFLQCSIDSRFIEHPFDNRCW